MTPPKDTLMKELLQIVQTEGAESLRSLLQAVCQAVLEAQMTQFLQAEPYERTLQRRGYRNGYKPRTLTTRLGPLELRVPQDREGRFSTQLFARYQRAGLAALPAADVSEGRLYSQVREITEALCTGEEALAVFHLPAAHRVRLRSTNGLEAFMGEVDRRARVVRIFPDLYAFLSSRSKI